jgi:hypothetical protein
MFKALGVAVMLYAAYAAVRGEVYAKDGASGRPVSRAESPEYFWVVIAIYAGLGIAMVTVF